MSSPSPGLPERDVDWEQVRQLAQRHRVMPLLYRSLSALRSGVIPETVLGRLRHDVQLNTVRNLILSKELIRVLRLLEQHRIPAIPFKGPALAAVVYGNVALRQFGDLDILVADRDYHRAQRLFVDEGFHRSVGHEWEQEFVDPTGTIAVDLHRRLTPREFPCPLKFEFLYGRLQRVEVAGASISTLSAEDSLLMLSIQVTKDSAVPLVKICDIAALLARRDVDCAKAMSNATRLGAARMLRYSIQLTADLLQTPVPGGRIDASFRVSVDGLLVDRRRRFHEPDELSTPDARVADCLRWIREERIEDKLLAAYRRYVTAAIVPCELDRRLLSFPPSLSFMYYLVRPLRLAAKYGLLFSATRR